MIVSAVSTVDDLLTVFSLGLDPDVLPVDLARLALDPDSIDLVRLVRLWLDLDMLESVFGRLKQADIPDTGLETFLRYKTLVFL